MSEHNGKLRHQNDSNIKANIGSIYSLSYRVGKELRRLLTQIRECRKSCQETTHLVGDVNDAIKE